MICDKSVGQTQTWDITVTYPLLFYQERAVHGRMNKNLKHSKRIPTLLFGLSSPITTTLLTVRFVPRDSDHVIQLLCRSGL